MASAPTQNKRKHGDVDTSSPQATSENLSPKKPKLAPSTRLPTSGGNVKKTASPKALTAASLSSSRVPKKAVGERTKPAPRRRGRTPVRRRTPSPQPLRSPSGSPPRQRKRPGGGARLDQAAVEAVKKRQREREEAAAQRADSEAARIGISNVVTQHYNAVPERGREWRQQGSTIKGLRSFNNWVKSAIIQKFSPKSSFTPGAYGNFDPVAERLKVLDIGCGKGGDLQKWQNAPQAVELYVALDPAEVSVEQARGRYNGMPKFGRNEFRGRPLFHGAFIAKDCFGESLADVPVIRQVGIDFSGGPISNGGFDVVSMMFCMHYAFESEAKARGMLQNVSGALKKGGRFLGVIPNSDVLSAKVRSLTKVGTKRAASPHAPQNGDDADDWNLEQSSEPAAKKQKVVDATADEDDWDPERPSDPNATADGPADDDDDWDPEKPTGPAAQPATVDGEIRSSENPHSTEATPETRNGIEWGNSMYRVKFPAKVPLDGVFRPSYGWKYFFFLEEAVEEIPEYVVPWEAFRAMAVDYNLELQYRKPFTEVWADEKDDPSLGPLSERMGVRARGGGELLVNEDELEAASFYHAFCFYKV